MSIYNSSYCGCIWHHGIKGQKWGVRRTSEELGHISSSAGKVAKSEKTATIVDGVYRSTKGFTAAVAKLAKYCLNPEKRHSKELFDVATKKATLICCLSTLKKATITASAATVRKRLMVKNSICRCCLA